MSEQRLPRRHLVRPRHRFGRKCGVDGIAALRRAGHHADMKRRPSERTPRRIAVVAFAGAQVLDVAGPLEVFSGANRRLAQERGLPPFYELEVVGQEAGPIKTSGALTLVADRGFGAATRQ